MKLKRSRKFWSGPFFYALCELREPLKIHFGGQANLFDSGPRQEKAALASVKADLSSLPEYNPDVSGLLAAQKQLLELPLIFMALRNNLWVSSQATLAWAKQFGAPVGKITPLVSIIWPPAQTVLPSPGEIFFVYQKTFHKNIT